MEYKITELHGYSPQIGHLAAMMNYARHTTLNAVQGLSVEQLDYLPSENSNSIGALLLHIAAVEFGFQVEIFEGRMPKRKSLNGVRPTALENPVEIRSKEIRWRSILISCKPFGRERWKSSRKEMMTGYMRRENGMVTLQTITSFGFIRLRMKSITGDRSEYSGRCCLSS